MLQKHGTIEAGLQKYPPHRHDQKTGGEEGQQPGSARLLWKGSGFRIKRTPVRPSAGLEEFAVARTIAIGLQLIHGRRITQVKGKAPDLLGTLAVWRCEPQWVGGPDLQKVTAAGGNQLHVKMASQRGDQRLR